MSVKYAYEDVRRLDPERYKLASLAPKMEREGLLALLAFNLELARIPELVSEPTMGLIRLQWWRDTLETITQGSEADLGHPVAELLRQSITQFNFTPSTFTIMLDTRAMDMAPEPIPDLRAFDAYAMGTSGALDRLFMEVLGQRDENKVRAAEHMGAAWAMTGLIRAIPFHAKAGRAYIPFSQDGEEQSAVLSEVCSLIETHLSEIKSLLGPRFDKTTAPVFLKVCMTRQFLKHLRLNKYNAFFTGVSDWQVSSIRLMANALFRFL